MIQEHGKDGQECFDQFSRAVDFSLAADYKMESWSLFSFLHLAKPITLLAADAVFNSSTSFLEELMIGT